MSVLRRGAAAARNRAAAVVHAETSPYGSRRLVIETDGTVTAAYLKDPGESVVGAVWVANHRAAPEGLDRTRLDAGTAPLLPESHVRRPEGRDVPEAGALEVVWFEEGDGVAVLEAGDPLFVIPGWSDMGRGIPGYARDAAEQSPFAFPLAEEIADFGTRIDRARVHWKTSRAKNSWADYQQSVLGHLLQRVGPGGRYLHDVGRRSANGKPGTMPTVGLTERPPRDGREFTVLSTVGMSLQRMPTIELYEQDVSPYARIELALASTLPARRTGDVFPWLAPRPWRSVTWFAPGDVVKWPHDDRPFPMGGEGREWAGVLLLEDPTRLTGPAPPALTGLTVQGDPVRWLWLVPVTAEEHRFAKTEGSDALVRRLAREGRTWVLS
ncbi:suppressor of fused domain protein [Actinomadura sp. WMMB 499]|uniref:suppressor of fused domain protein n=1 Tax=Actinomadura sp. WMMB 499 TaxID=1219491 RepID=UPI001245AB69|nr:suppressor of fused domain protein [Actinomadura sp. WMMB 499]QFG25487.1 suppressor of fused domain protein [Actinomadura sp. WMMB 499]